MKNVVAAHAVPASENIRRGVSLWVPNVQTFTAWVREHVENVVFGLRGIEADVTRIGRVVSLRFCPAMLPFGFEIGERVLFALAGHVTGKPCILPGMSNVSKQRLLLATRNSAKVREVREVLGERFCVDDLTLYPQMPEIEETGETFEDNARLKVLEGVRHSEGWVLADDSGLEVDALGGAPGVRSARFAGENVAMEAHRALLLERLRGVPMEKRQAKFRCVLALARAERTVQFFTGTIEGHLTLQEKGSGGFGYDSLFIPLGETRTFAEMTSAEKHALSHRGRALAALADFLSSI